MTLWGEKIRIFPIHSAKMMWDGFANVLWVSEHLFHDDKPSRSHFWQNFINLKFGLKSHFLPCELDFACQNAIFQPTRKLIEPSVWVIGTNHFIQRYFGSISKASRARFSILFLLFEKKWFFFALNRLSALKMASKYMYITCEKWLCGVKKKHKYVGCLSFCEKWLLDGLALWKRCSETQSISANPFPSSRKILNEI